jgi:hypothetical protein
MEKRAERTEPPALTDIECVMDVSRSIGQLISKLEAKPESSPAGDTCHDPSGGLRSPSEF